MQEIGVMGFTGVNPVVIVLNNGLYGVEALISETGHSYNDLPPWRYADIPPALGCNGWWCGRLQQKNNSNRHWQQSTRTKERPTSKC